MESGRDGCLGDGVDVHCCGGGGRAHTCIMRQSRIIRLSFLCGGFSKMSITIESDEAECKQRAYW